MLKSFITQPTAFPFASECPWTVVGHSSEARTIVRRLELVEQDAPASNFSHF